MVARKAEQCRGGCVLGFMTVYCIVVMASLPTTYVTCIPDACCPHFALVAPHRPRPPPTHTLQTCMMKQDHGLDMGLDVHLIPHCKPALPDGPGDLQPEPV